MRQYMVRLYSHDYTNDTGLVWRDDGERAELELTFESEDPDVGTETLYYGGDAGTSMWELSAECAQELTGWLDRHDGPADPESLDLVYEDFTRTALYAFESILYKTAKEEQK